MIRKQIYLEADQQEAIRSKAAARGISEAEVIRLAIDDSSGSSQHIPADPAAWNRALRLMRSLQRKGKVRKSEARKFNRAELYEDRLGRYERHSR